MSSAKAWVGTRTEGQQLMWALDPDLVWLAHEHEPWRRSTA